MRRLAQSVLIFLSVLAAAHSAVYYRWMPDPMAVHFGAAGVPNGWSSKTGYFGLSALILVMDLLIFLVIPALLSRYRVEKVNVPRASYWLAPENLDAFYEFFRARMALFGAANVILGMCVSHLVFRANLDPAGTLDNRIFVLLLSAYFVFVIIWLFTLFRKLVSEGRGS